ncbi:hypothetical protein [Kushneria aurantia]|uniref:Uncharacterized protein n=1 Tax=Kushneria aurantia TaxID=504092 RepID=A0ABV6G4H7_9GAMM|nr:hypothetical protein [Kushneria aurantia]
MPHLKFFDAGRVIAYGGGTGVSATSVTARAAPHPAITPSPGEIVSLLNAPLMQFGGVQIVIADVISVGGIVLVAARLTFDVWSYLDKRRRDKRREGRHEGR